MKITVKPSVIDGSITAPPSKSVMQRAVAAAILSGGELKLYNPSFSSDSLSALGIAAQLGFDIKKQKDHVLLKQSGKAASNTFNCGESGLCMRMFPPVLSLRSGKMKIIGEGSLLARPVDMIEEPLRELGVMCKTNGGRLPIELEGPMKGGTATVDGTISSQFLSGLLLALPAAPQDSTLKVKNLQSKPYIDITLGMLLDFGIEIEHKNYEEFHIKGNRIYTMDEYRIEGDWSGASFMLAAGAIAGKIKVSGLKMDSKQADIRILEALEMAGTDIKLTGDTAIVAKNELHHFDFDATDCPDLFPPLVALASLCKGTSLIYGASRLRHKESDRAAALQTEFAAMGVQVEVDDDIMKVHGGKIKGGAVSSHNDHRIAMACAAAAVAAEKPVSIKDAGCVKKSYPGFYRHLKAIGVEVDEQLR